MPSNLGTDELKQKEIPFCRICYGEYSETDTDWLISPCECNGSIKHIHFSCLQKWIETKNPTVFNITDYSYSYLAEIPSCDLCNKSYASGVLNGLTIIPITSSIPILEPPIIVLENLIKDNNMYKTRSFHVISLANNKVVKIGRSREADISIADVSISKIHATIRYENSEFLIHDNKSKFGTMVAMGKPMCLEENKIITLQLGRTRLTLEGIFVPPIMQ